MKSKMIALMVLGFASNVFAGEGGTYVLCKSTSGKTKVEIETSDFGSAMVKVSLRRRDGQGDHVATYMNRMLAENLEINHGDIQRDYPGAKIGAIVEVAEKHVIAYVVTDDEGYGVDPVRLISTSGSVKLKSGVAYDLSGTFKAVLTGIDHRVAEGADYISTLQPVEVNCTYEYSI